MPSFPRITAPCPLEWSELPDGPCSACGKSVLNLSGMDDKQRRAAIGGCGASACVSYRVPLSVALAAGLIASSVVPPVASASDALNRNTESLLISPAKQTPILDLDQPSDPGCDELMYIVVGGVDDPAEAQWASVPETAPLRSLPSGDEHVFLGSERK